MPLVKLYADSPDRAGRVAAVLPELRDLLCAELSTEPAVCHLVVIPALGLTDQPPVAVEMWVLPKPGRTRDVMLKAATRARDLLVREIGGPVSVRTTLLDPERYMALR